MENSFGHWVYPRQTEALRQVDLTKFLGFIYLIVNNCTGKKYIGKKLLVNKKKRKPLRGRVNARRYLIESSW
jgi:uncharacterized membrane protein YoaT (DUF817 family)